MVRLAKELFYSGNAVILDHGAGVFTSYSHMSRIDVKVGQTVERGALLYFRNSLVASLAKLEILPAKK